MRLMRKVAIITGSGRGIGQEIAVLFASEGARIVIADVNAENASRAAADIAATGGEAYGLKVDITDPAQVESLMQQTLIKYGWLDILVNNAGVGLSKPFLDTSLEEWERVLRINLTGTFLCAQSAAREMLKSGSGKIINIASISGQRGGQGRAAYGAAKAGVILLTQVMAVELAPRGISVNAIAPGPVDTDQSRETHTEATRHAYHQRLPIKRYGELREIANAALFLASDESSFIVGHVLNVDGGFRAAGLMFEADDELARRDQPSEPLRPVRSEAPPADKRRTT